MLKIFKGWFERYLSDEEALLFLLLLFAIFFVIITYGEVLAPVFIAIVSSYLLQGGMHFLKRKGVSHLLATITMFLFFVAILLVLILVILPAIWRQATQFVYELPNMLGQAQGALMLLPERYPDLISEGQITQWTAQVNNELAGLGQWLVSVSFHSIPGLVTVLIYAVLVPILIFFFLKDGSMILNWFASFLPRKRDFMNKIWIEMEQQVANYVRGKVLEIIIIGVATYIAFLILGLNYAALLAILVGLSVLIPYIGAAVVTVPVTLIAYFQWGNSDAFIYLMVVYGILQALDGNVLVPLLFSEVVNLHPVAIIVAVLMFGGIWGFWGIFFAIPLATLLKAMMTSWPKQIEQQEISEATEQ